MILYHITPTRQVNKILSQGLIPKFDPNIASIKLKKGVVINLVDELNVPRIIRRFENLPRAKTKRLPPQELYPEGGITILKIAVDPEDIQKVHHRLYKDLSWYISTKTIPPENILETIPTEEW